MCDVDGREARWHKRRLLLALAGSAVLNNAGHAQIAAWPQRALRVVVASRDDQQLESIASLVIPQLSNVLRFPIERVSAPGPVEAATILVSRSQDPDLILFSTSTLIGLQTSVTPLVEVNAVQAAAPAALLPIGLFVPRPSQFTAVRDLIAAGLARDIRSYGTPQVGSPEHLAGAMFATMARLVVEHVPYRSVNAALSGLRSGETDFGFAPLTAALQSVVSGDLRLLGVATSRRLAAMPNVPTIAEAGALPGYAVDQQGGLFVPRAAPPEARQRLSNAMLEVVRSEELRARAGSLGLELISGDADSFARNVVAERQRALSLRWSPIHG